MRNNLGLVTGGDKRLIHGEVSSRLYVITHQTLVRPFRARLCVLQTLPLEMKCFSPKNSANDRFLFVGLLEFVVDIY